jgi:Thioredoxin like C-terminal domain/AhpC/TSA family
MNDLMRPGTEIYAPDFPADTDWINAKFVRMATLLGSNAPLVWFWDLASLNSLRALPYVLEWHRRYEALGLRVIGVHSPQFDFGHDPAAVEREVRRLEIPFPVASDSDFAIWRLYGNEVWPALYLWDRRGVLRHYHYAEGAYDETESALGEVLLEIDAQAELPPAMPALRATDRPGALVRPPTPHTYLNEDRSAREVAAGERLHIRYAAAGAAAVLDGDSTVEVLLDGNPVRTLTLEGPRIYELIGTGEHAQHDLTLAFKSAARAYAFSFAPGPA